MTPQKIKQSGQKCCFKWYLCFCVKYTLLLCCNSKPFMNLRLMWTYLELLLRVVLMQPATTILGLLFDSNRLKNVQLVFWQQNCRVTQAPCHKCKCWQWQTCELYFCVRSARNIGEIQSFHKSFARSRETLSPAFIILPLVPVKLSRTLQVVANECNQGHQVRVRLATSVFPYSKNSLQMSLS